VSSDDVQTLRDAYGAFARQDIPSVMAAFHEDIEWQGPDSVPWGGDYHGHDGVGRFFGQLGDYWQELKVEPEEFIEAGDTIVVLIRLSGTGAGGSTDSKSLHLWPMRDGKAASFREYPDTARALQATGQRLPAAV
jgi:ketosteroid isomerase-like protein